MKILALTAVVLLGGCQLILGLDETRVGDVPDADAIDAKIDAPPEIDAPPACMTAPPCTSSTGRSLCGQIYGTGDQAGPLRSATPTGLSCTESGNTDGPCAMTITGSTVAQFDDASMSSAPITGTIDDCGRFAIPDLDATGKPIMVVATGTGLVQTNTLYPDREAAAGADDDARALNVSVATTMMWADQLVPGGLQSLTAGILYTFRQNGTPRVGVRAAIDQMNPPNKPFFAMDGAWAAYFVGAVPFGAMDATNKDDLTSDPVVPAMGSEASGTGYAAYGAVNADVDGFRVGVRCTVDLHLDNAPTGFLVVTIDGC